MFAKSINPEFEDEIDHNSTYELNELILDSENQQDEVYKSFIHISKDSPLQNLGQIMKGQFLWLLNILNIGNKRPFQQEDVYMLRKEDSTKYNYNIFEKILNPYQGEKYNLKWLIFKTFTGKVFLVWTLETLSSVSNILQPMIMKLLLDNLYDRYWDTYFIGFIALLAFRYMLTASQSNLLFHDQLLKTKLGSVLQVQLLKKILSYTIIRNSYYKLGDIVNLVQVDIPQMTQLWKQSYCLFLFPIELIGAILISNSLIGWNETLIGIIIACTVLLLNVFFSFINLRMQKKFMLAKDSRMRSLEEMMGGIKTIKYNSMEEIFDKKLYAKRNKEINILYYQQAIFQFVKQIVGSGSFTNALLIAHYGKISNLKDFIFLSSSFSAIMNILIKLPEIIQQLSIAIQSHKRYEQFQNQPDHVPLKFLTQFTENDNIALEVNNPVNFTWEEQLNESSSETKKLIAERRKYSYDEDQQKKSINEKDQESLILKKLQFKINKGELVAFVGENGAGKSSIIYAIFGEMLLSNQRMNLQNIVKINGTISLAQQDPWIIQGSIRDNIILDQKFNLQRYKSALFYSALIEDLEQLKNGDQTEVAEKGDSLSGGQRKRISLARCIYNNSDIIIMDNILAALDLKVVDFVMEECICGYLRNKTRIMIQNDINNLQNVDRIFVVKDGEIKFVGNYEACRIYLDSKQIEPPESEDDTFFRQLFQSKQVQSKIDRQTFSQNKDFNLQQEKDVKKLLEKEDKESGSIQTHIIIMLFHMVLGYNPYIRWARAILILLLMTTSGALNYYASVYLYYITNADYRQSILQYSYFLILNNVVMLIQNQFILFLFMKMSKLLHQKITFNLLRASFPKFYNIILTGRIMNRLSQDIQNVDYSLPNYLILMLNYTIYMSAHFINFLVAEAYLYVFIVILFSTFCFYLNDYYLKSMREATRLQAISKSPILSYVTQILRGALYARSCISQNYIMDKHMNNIDLDIRNVIAKTGLNAFYFHYKGILQLVFVIIIYTIAMADSSINSQIETQLIQQTMWAVSLSSWMFENITQLQIFTINFERCYKLAFDIELEQEVFQKQEVKELVISQNQKDDVQDEEVVRFQNCYFKYREDLNPVLKDFTFKVKKGEKIGIVGRTGAGKTSLTLALSRMIDISEGNLFIKQQNTRYLELKQLRNLFSVIPQEPFIFEGTLRENLDPFKQIDDETIKKVINQVGIDNFNVFKNGSLNSQISVMGENLSNGEKQLISIARTILRQADIILIDEATSNIDEQVEKLITKTFKEQLKDKTVIIIAHKIKTILQSDKILVMDSGKVQQYDTPENLLTDPNSMFSEIIRLMYEAKK